MFVPKKAKAIERIYYFSMSITYCLILIFLLVFNTQCLFYQMRNSMLKNRYQVTCRCLNFWCTQIKVLLWHQHSHQKRNYEISNNLSYNSRCNFWFYLTNLNSILYIELISFVFKKTYIYKNNIVQLSWIIRNR